MVQRYTPRGATIRLLREHLGYSQREVCIGIGMSERMLRDIEKTDRPASIQTLQEIADFLDTSVDIILSLSAKEERHYVESLRKGLVE